MKFGVHIPNIGEYADPPLLVEMAQTAEERGWDGVVPEKVGSPMLTTADVADLVAFVARHRGPAWRHGRSMS